MTDPTRVTLYDPDGQPYTVRADNVAEQTRLRSQGYSTEPAFDPAKHGVEDVVQHLRLADNQEQARVLAAEARGAARTGVLGATLDVGPVAGDTVQVPVPAAVNQPKRQRAPRAKTGPAAAAEKAATGDVPADTPTVPAVVPAVEGSTAGT